MATDSTSGDSNSGVASVDTKPSVASLLRAFQQSAASNNATSNASSAPHKRGMNNPFAALQSKPKLHREKQQPLNSGISGTGATSDTGTVNGALGAPMKLSKSQRKSMKRKQRKMRKLAAAGQATSALGASGQSGDFTGDRDSSSNKRRRFGSQ